MFNLENLKKTDPAIADLIQKEIQRQRDGFELIASENIASEAVIEAMGTPLTNKYSEGYPGKRYYGGNQVIDEIESLAIARAKELFGAEHANVQPNSGSQANQAAYMAFAAPGDTIMAMNLAHGGHLTHGSPVNASGKIYKFVHYGVRRDTERIDMDEVRTLAREHLPKIIVAGYTAYPRHLDFAAFRAIADEVGAIFMVDMAHFAGLVAAKLHPDPVPYADVVTTTTHKTLRGPRGGMILAKAAHAKAVDSAVFPGLQGGPLDHVIAAKAVCFAEALKPSFVDYQRQVLANAQTLAQTLTAEDIRPATGGTDNHLLLLDLSKYLTGKEAEKHLEDIGLSVNKNMIPFDPRKPLDPSGLRIGTPAVTTRGLKEKETAELGRIIASVIKTPTEAVKENARAEVRKLAEKFPLPY
jgi:glycine hydroxymethyltransferase